MSSTTPPQSFPWVPIIFSSVFAITLCAAVFFGYHYFQTKADENITTFEQCTNLKGAIMTTSYPSRCTLPDGSRSFTEAPSDTPMEKPQSQACTEEAKICPDGSSVGRTGPNCAFAPCP